MIFGDGASGAMQGAAILRMAQLSEPLPGHGSGTHELLPARQQLQPQQQSEKQQQEQGKQQQQEQGPARQKQVLGQGQGQGPLQQLTADGDDDSVSSAGCSGQQSCASPSTACWGSGARGGAHGREPLSRSYEQPASSGPGSPSCDTLPFGALGRRASSCPLDIRLAQLTAASAKSHVSSLEAQLAACEANAAKQRLLLQQQLEEAKNAAKREKRRLKHALAVAPGGTVSGGSLPYEPTLKACPPATHPSPSQMHPLLCPAASYPSYAHPSPPNPSPHYIAPGRSMPLSSHSDGRLQGAADAPRWGSAGGRATTGRRRTVPDQTHEAVAMPQPSGHGFEYSQGGPGYAHGAEAAMVGPYGHPQGSRQRARSASPRPSGPCNAGRPGKHSAVPFDVHSAGVPSHEAWQHGQQQQQQLSRQASLPHSSRLQHASSQPLGHAPAAPHYTWPPPHPPSYTTAADGIPPPQLAWQHSHPPPGSYPHHSHNSHSMGQAWQGAPDSMQPAPAAVHNGERRRKSSKAAAPGPATRHAPPAHAMDPGHLPPHFPTQPHLHPYPVHPDMPQGHLGAEAHEAHAPEHAPFDPVHAHTSAPYPFYPGYPEQHVYSQPYPCAGACPAPMPGKKRKAKSHKRQHAPTPAAAAAGSVAAGPAGALAIPVAAGVESGHSGMDHSMLHGLAPGGGGGAAWGGQAVLGPTAGAAAECAAQHPAATAGQDMRSCFGQGAEAGAGDADAQAAAVAAAAAAAAAAFAAAGSAGTGSPQPRRRRSQTKQPKQPRRAGRGQGGAQAHDAQTDQAATGIDQGAFVGLGVQELDTPFADGLMAALAAAAAFEQGQAGAGLQWVAGPGAEGAAGAGPLALDQGHASCTGVAAEAVAQDGIGAAGPKQPCEGGAAANVQQQQQQDGLAAAAMLASGNGGAGGAVGAPAPGQPDMAAVADAFPVPESGAAQVPAWDELEQCLFSDADDLFQDLF